MNLADLCIRRPVFATMLVMSLVVLGLFTYRRLGLDLFPNIDFPIVTVTTTVAIATLKIFDIVFSVSGGLNHDNVVAVRMFQEMFQFFNETTIWQALDC